MEKLKALALEHFSQETDAEGEKVSGMIVFAEYRDCVDEIVLMLNEERPMLRATRFIGQGTDKQGKKGIAQKDQIEASCKMLYGDYAWLTICYRSSNDLRMASSTF